MDLQSLSRSVANMHASDCCLAEKTFADYLSPSMATTQGAALVARLAEEYQNPWMNSLEGIKSCLGFASAARLAEQYTNPWTAAVKGTESGMGMASSVARLAEEYLTPWTTALKSAERLSDRIKSSIDWMSAGTATAAEWTVNTGLAARAIDPTDSFTSLCKTLGVQYQAPSWYNYSASDAIQKAAEGASVYEHLARESERLAKMAQQVCSQYPSDASEAWNNEEADSDQSEPPVDVDADAVRASMEELVVTVQSLSAASTTADDSEAGGDSLDCMICGFLCGLVPAKFMEEIFEPSLCDQIAARVDECLAQGRPAAEAAVTPREKSLLALQAFFIGLWNQLRDMLFALIGRPSKS